MVKQAFTKLATFLLATLNAILLVTMQAGIVYISIDTGVCTGILLTSIWVQPVWLHIAVSWSIDPFLANTDLHTDQTMTQRL